MSEKIKLTPRENGDYQDKNDCHWTYFIIDRFAQEEDGECSECGAVTDYDCYFCLDDGSEVCTDCVEIQDV